MDLGGGKGHNSTQNVRFGGGRCQDAERETLALETWSGRPPLAARRVGGELCAGPTTSTCPGTKVPAQAGAPLGLWVPFREVTG